MSLNGSSTRDKEDQRLLATPLPGARAALLLLLCINLFNYIDRQVLAAVEPQIRAELLEGDPNAKTKMGLLSTAFLVTYMIVAPVFGWLADHVSRWKLIGIGVLLWSLASGASGVNWHRDLAVAYWILLATRCFVGVGEGGYGPVAPTVLSDLYPQNVRGRVLSWFYLAIPVGAALGYTLGGQMAAMPNWGWRYAFYVVVPPGVLLGLLCFFMRDPARGQADLPGKPPPRRAKLRDYLSLLHIPSYLLNTLGMTAMTFAIGGLAYWMPDFLKVHDVPGLVLPGVGTINRVTVFGALTALGGLFGTLLGGIAGDRLRPRLPGSYFLVSGVAMIVGFPMILGVVFVPFPWGWIFVFMAVFCLFFNTGPTNTILANVTHPSVRATGFALNILIIHALGDAISPAVIGFIADLHLRPTEADNTDLGFILISLLTLVGGLIWLRGARYLERDTALAPTRLDSEHAA
jgi:MFS transporter, Spinster family, sphingosine-1-phosphate transporter